MILQLLVAASLFSSAQETPSEFTIHRVEPQNRAVVASKQAGTVSVGQEFTVETPYGECHMPVTKVIEDYFYLDTQQCQSDFVSKGTVIHPTRKIEVQAAEPAPVVRQPESETVTSVSDMEESPFYKDYIKTRASAYISYYTGNTLDGSIAYANSTSVSDLKGSNAVGLGVDYKIAELPYSMDVMGGFAYALPRSFGSYSFASTAGSGRRDFNANPDLQMASLYFDLRYQFADRAYALFGMNRLFTRLTKMPGSMSGDLGFHLGARYYPIPTASQLFVDGDLNFYNMNYKEGAVRADFSLTELEVKAGYTF